MPIHLVIHRCKVPYRKPQGQKVWRQMKAGRKAVHECRDNRRQGEYCVLSARFGSVARPPLIVSARCRCIRYDSSGATHPCRCIPFHDRQHAPLVVAPAELVARLHPVRLRPSPIGWPIRRIDRTERRGMDAAQHNPARQEKKNILAASTSTHSARRRA